MNCLKCDGGDTPNRANYPLPVVICKCYGRPAELCGETHKNSMGVLFDTNHYTKGGKIFHVVPPKNDINTSQPALPAERQKI